VRAIVLVGGEGTRLRPLTLSTPKQMLPILGCPMLEWVLGHLRHHGVTEAVLSLGYLPDAFMSAYPDGVAAGVRLRYVVEPEPYDTAGAIRFAATTAGIDDTFVVVNGDILTDMDLGALLRFHRARHAEGSISLHPVDDPSSFGVVPTDPDGSVVAFVEKPSREDAPTNLINAGTYVLEPGVLDRIPLGRRVSVERETFPAMVRSGTLYALADEAYWLDTGTPRAYMRAHWDLLDGSRGLPPVPGAERIGRCSWRTGAVRLDGEVQGACFFGDGAVVEAGAVVESAVLGAGALVESGAVVTGSVLLDRTRVAERATVSESILGSGSVVGARAEILEASVLGPGAVVASGTRTAGERIT